MCSSTTIPTRGRGERGSVATELVLVAPLVIVLLLAVGYAGRVTRAQTQVRHTAAQAARAASLRQLPANAIADAQAVAASALSSSKVSCASLDVNVDTSQLRPGGRVVVEVRCRASLGDLALLGVPGSRTLTARSVEVIDSRRGG
ncbi:MAG TPA: TadE family protein [Acidimicrobiales bacterium]